jgi:hypothetical protein
MHAKSMSVVSELKSPGVCADQGFFAKPETYDQIYAYAREMDWMEKPFHFVVSRWLDRRRACASVHGEKIWINRRPSPTCH